MKQVFIVFLAMGLIVSCTNVKESKEYKDLQAQRDSLLMHTAEAETEVAEMMSVISEVEENFERIRKAEKYISTQSTQQGEMTQSTKERVTDNFNMINEILERNRVQIEELNKRYGSSNNELASLKNTIDRLNREMKESANRLVALQKELELKDEQIAQLSQDITSLALETEMQSETIKEQDRSLNTAHYVFGTEKELKDQKILSGGFLQATRVLQDTFNKEYFLTIDIREATEIPLYAPKAKVWSTHPDDTYQMVKGEDGNLILQVVDTQRFWSLTKYLIVEVN